MSEENTPVDEESAKLLAEIEAQGTTPAPAADKSRSRAKPAPRVINTLKPIEEAPAVEEAQRNRTITNTSKNPRRIGGVTVPVGGTYDLTDHDLADESLMSKIEHSVKMGVLSRDDNRGL